MNDAENPTEPPTQTLPPLRAEILPGTAFDTLNAMTENVIDNLREALPPRIEFPSLWRLAKHLVGERGPLLVYRYEQEPR